MNQWGILCYPWLSIEYSVCEKFPQKFLMALRNLNFLWKWSDRGMNTRRNAMLSHGCGLSRRANQHVFTLQILTSVGDDPDLDPDPTLVNKYEKKNSIFKIRMFTDKKRMRIWKNRTWIRSKHPNPDPKHVQHSQTDFWTECSRCVDILPGIWFG